MIVCSAAWICVWFLFLVECQPVMVPTSVRERIHSSSSNVFCCRVLSFFEHIELRIEKETTFFWEIARGPLHCQDIKNSEHSSPLPGINDCIQVLLSFTSGPRALTGASLTCGNNATPVLLRPCSLNALRPCSWLHALLEFALFVYARRCRQLCERWNIAGYFRVENDRACL